MKKRILSLTLSMMLMACILPLQSFGILTESKPINVIAQLKLPYVAVTITPAKIGDFVMRPMATYGSRVWSVDYTIENNGSVTIDAQLTGYKLLIGHQWIAGSASDVNNLNNQQVITLYQNETAMNAAINNANNAKALALRMEVITKSARYEHNRWPIHTSAVDNGNIFEFVDGTRRNGTHTGTDEDIFAGLPEHPIFSKLGAPNNSLAVLLRSQNEEGHPIQWTRGENSIKYRFRGDINSKSVVNWNATADNVTLVPIFKFETMQQPANSPQEIFFPNHGVTTLIRWPITTQVNATIVLAAAPYTDEMVWIFPYSAIVAIGKNYKDYSLGNTQLNNSYNNLTKDCIMPNAPGEYKMAVLNGDGVILSLNGTKITVTN